MKNFQLKLIGRILLLLIAGCTSAFTQTEQIRDSLISAQNDSLTTRTDTTTISDSLITLTQDAASDTTVVITGNVFFDESIILSNNDLLKSDYRYTGDFFKLHGFSFTKDYGFIGQNNETMIYGTGFGGISYFEDGVLINNRSLNQLDLNNIPSELIDSIEILPAVRGFLYGSLNNPVSINFISKDRVPGLAFSRIKYYEGPFGEALIDGIVSTKLFRKLILYFEAQNKKVDRRYLNSSSSSWLGRIKLKYFMNDFINLQASYGYVRSTKGLNGGVLIDSIGNTSNLNSIMYNEVLAPVRYSERSYDIKQHHLGLRALSNISDFSRTDLNLYYKFSLEELNNTENPVKLDEDVKDKTLGVSLRQLFSKNIFSFELNGVYESTNFMNRLYFQVDTLPVALTDFLSDRNNYSASGIFSIRPFNKKIKLSGFFKLVGIKYDFMSTTKNLGGYGLDIHFKPSEKISLYAGYSYFEPNQYAEEISTFEGAVKYSDENFEAGVRAFMRQSEIIQYPEQLRDLIDPFNPYQDMVGIELNVKTKFWKLLFEGRGAFYSGGEDTYDIFNIPEQYFNTGIYFTDTLFNSNLDLKAGFVYYFTGEQDLYNYTVPSSSRIDFTVAGDIQKTAIVYFTWENLLGAEYFIVPYYPMPLRGIRFGVAWEFLN